MRKTMKLTAPDDVFVLINSYVAAAAAARAMILDAYSRDTWAYLARDARESFPAVRDLALQLREPGTPWEAQRLTPPDYFAQLHGHPEEARDFARMLYEIHVPLADELAASLPVGGVERLPDVGGGSGIMPTRPLTISKLRSTGGPSDGCMSRAAHCRLDAHPPPSS